MYTDYLSIFLPFSLISSTSALYFFSHRLWIYFIKFMPKFFSLFFFNLCPCYNWIVCVWGVVWLCECVIVGVLSIFWVWICYQIYAFQIFSPVFWVVFFLIVSSISSTKVLNFDEVQFIYFIIDDHTFCVNTELFYGYIVLLIAVLFFFSF